MIEINVLDGPLAGIEADVLVVLGFEDRAPAAVDEAVSGWASEVYGSGEFSGKPYELAILHRPTGIKARRLALAGAGKRNKLDETEMRKAVATAVRTLKGRSMRRVYFWLEQPELAQVAVEGAVLGDFEPDQLKTDPKKNEKRLESFTIAVAQIAARLIDKNRR